MQWKERYKRRVPLWVHVILTMSLLLGLTLPALAQDGGNPAGSPGAPTVGPAPQGIVPGIVEQKGPQTQPQQPVSAPPHEQAANSLFLPFVPQSGNQSPQAGAIQASAIQAVLPVDMKVLVIAADGNETDFPYITSYLQQLGIPYDTLLATTTPLTAATLSDGTKGFYQGIILVTGSLVYYDPNTNSWPSAFTTDEWNILELYERTYGVRQVTSYTAPYAGAVPDNLPGAPANYGLNLVAQADTTTQAMTASLTPAGQQIYSDLNPSNPVTFKNAWIYLACPSSVTSGTAVGSACSSSTQIAATTPTTPLLQTAEGYAIASIHQYADGRQNLAITVANNPFLIHSLLLSYGTVNWLTNGMYLGERRITIDPQVDDLFIDSDMWSTALMTDTGFFPEGSPQHITYRTTGDDFLSLIAWQNSMRTTYPLASALTLEWSFNGEGASGIYPSDTLTPAVQANTNAFNYVNHTYTHANLDQATAVTVTNELKQNNRFATSNSSWFQPSHYFKNSLVQPDISGLYNAVFLNTAYNWGIRYLISDTSRPGWNNPTPNAGFYSTLQPGMLIIPRRPTNLFYNLRTPDEWVSEYNCYYDKNYTGPDPYGTCANSPWKYWDQSLTYAEILDKESDLWLQYLLKWDWDPLMFHQANTATYDGVHSLIGDLITATLAKYSAVYKVPLVSQMERELGIRMARRMAYDASGVKATLTPCSNRSRTLTISTVNPARIPVTGLLIGSVRESYAGQTTSYLQLAANQTATYNLACR